MNMLDKVQYMNERMTEQRNDKMNERLILFIYLKLNNCSFFKCISKFKIV